MINLKYFNLGKTPDLEEVLQNREFRREKIDFLKDKYESASILCFKLNIPGPIKYNNIILEIFQIGKNEILGEINKNGIEILFKEETLKSTGPELFLAVSQTKTDLKK